MKYKESWNIDEKDIKITTTTEYNNIGFSPHVRGLIFLRKTGGIKNE